MSEKETVEINGTPVELNGTVKWYKLDIEKLLLTPERQAIMVLARCFNLMQFKIRQDLYEQADESLQKFFVECEELPHIHY